MSSIINEHHVTLSDGANLYVKVLGDPSPSRPLLITLHGAPGLSSHAEPEATFGFLQSKFRVLVYDARGSGISDLKQPYTHERWIADVEELRIWAGAEKFVLAGGSYGGFVALDYALVHQDRLLGLILRDTWAWGARGMMQALKACLTSTRVSVDPERQYRMWTGILKDDADFVQGVTEMATLFTPEFPRKVAVDATAKEQENSPNKPTIHAATQNWAFSQNMPRFDVRARLKEIHVRTFVAVGRQDVITPVDFSEEIAEGIPGADLNVFEGSGHHPAQDEGEEFRVRLGGFVEGLGF